MSERPRNILDRSKELARGQILASVKERYFPEVWYILESWLSMAKAKTALEVGYGLGLVGDAMARSGWKVTVHDPSEAALADVKARFEKSGVTGTFTRGGFEALPFEDQSFSAVACINTLEFTANPDGLLKEITRVLAPGGRAVIASFNKLSPWGLPAVAHAIRVKGVGDDPRPARCFSKDEFASFLKGQGFNIEAVKERAQFLPVAPALSKLRLPFAGAFVALVIKPAAGKTKTSKQPSKAPLSKPPVAKTPGSKAPARSSGKKRLPPTKK